MDWNDLKYFLAVAREGQMLSAAGRIGVSQARLSRHIASLEDAVGARLFDRTTRGSTLTKDGEALFVTAEKIETEVLCGIAKLKGQDDVTGVVRIGAPDGFGSAFLAARLGQLWTAYPKLRIQLVPVPRSFSLSEREADIAIMVGRPKEGRLRVRKLTDYTLRLYGAREYLDRYGTPTSLKSLNDHSLIGYVDDLLYSQELDYASEFLQSWQSQIEVATAIGQFEAVCAGVGIGICHDFMAKDVVDLIPLFPEHQISRSYWIVWHENLRAARRVTAVVDGLCDLVRDERAIFVSAPTIDLNG